MKQKKAFDPCLEYLIESPEFFIEPNDIDFLKVDDYYRKFNLIDSESEEFYDNYIIETKYKDNNENIKEDENKNKKEENSSTAQKDISSEINEIGKYSINMKEMSCIDKKKTSKNESTKAKILVGRKRKRSTASSKGPHHGKFSEDNISVKVKIHYLNFIISFLNCIFSHLNYNKGLSKLTKGFKINIKKSNIESLNNKTIGDIISNEISIKYTTIDDKINANKDIYEEIKNNPILNKILSENYLTFFKKFYYRTDSKVNLKDYGLNKDIKFTEDVKNYKHLLLKKGVKEDDEYKMFIIMHIHRNYLPGLKFICVNHAK